MKEVKKLIYSEEEFFEIINKFDETKDYIRTIQKAVSEMRKKKFNKPLEIVINDNLISVFNNASNVHTIFGCRISFDNLPNDISFVIREDNKLSYYEMEFRWEYFKHYLMDKYHETQNTIFLTLVTKMNEFEVGDFNG